MFRPIALSLAAAAALMVVSTPALASNNPIPGIDVVVQKKPSGSALRVKTDGSGGFILHGLSPGQYELELSGASLKSAMETVDPKTGGPAYIAVLVALLLPAVRPGGAPKPVTQTLPIGRRQYQPLLMRFAVDGNGSIPNGPPLGATLSVRGKVELVSASGPGAGPGGLRISGTLRLASGASASGIRK